MKVEDTALLVRALAMVLAVWDNKSGRSATATVESAQKFTRFINTGTAEEAPKP